MIGRQSPIAAPLLRTYVLATVLLCAGGGCKMISPSNDRVWSPGHARVPWAEIDQTDVTLHNVRNFTYRAADDFDPSWYDKTYDLAKLDSVDFIVVPFANMPGVAHTMLSFGFGGEEYVALSVETRREAHEKYSPTKGFARQFELIYVLGDERDLIQLRSIHWKDDVFVYRARATPRQARALFLDVCQRANQLRDKPEFYDTVANNCTTNLWQHVNNVAPSRIPYNYQILFNGYSDRLAYNLGLIDNSESFERTRERARINRLAYIHRESEAFSRDIRRL